MLRSTPSLLAPARRAALSGRVPVKPLATFATKSTPERAIWPRGRRSTPFGVVPLIRRTEYSTKPPVPPTHGDKALEEKTAQQKLEPHPEQVSAKSSIRPVLETSQGAANDSKDVAQDLKKDLKNVKETFALNTVPRESYMLGLAGTLPYVGSALSTVYLVWDIQTAWPSQSQLLNHFMISHESASHLLSLLEPVQIGFGALIISFLGAVHWGMELIERQAGHDTARARFRYAMGYAAPLVAWPTLLMPMQWALISQFLTFLGMYFADARATSRGWAPQWYAIYRFVLTGVVGASLVLTLVARARLSEEYHAHLSERELRGIISKGKSTMGERPYQEFAKLEEKEIEEKHKREEEEKRKKEEEEKKEKEKKKEEGGDKEKGKGDEKKGEEMDKKGEEKEKKGEKKGEEGEKKSEEKEKKD